MEDKSVELKYKNWEGEVAIRHVVPIELWYGSTEWHKDPQWLLKVHDLDKDSERDYAMKDILQWGV